MEYYLGLAVLSAVLGVTVATVSLSYVSVLPDSAAGLRKWAIGVFLLGTHGAASLTLGVEGPQSGAAFVGVEVAHLVGALLMLAGTHAFREEAQKNYVFIGAGVLGLGWLIALTVFLPPGLAAFAVPPFYLLVGGLVVVSGVQIMRTETVPTQSSRFIGGVLITWGAFIGISEFLAFTSLVDLMRLIGGQGFGLWVAVGLIIVALRQQGTLLEEARQRAKVSEEKAKERAKGIRLVLDSLPDSVVISNAAGVVVDVNPQAETLFGLGREDLVGQTVSSLLPVRGNREEDGGLISRMVRDPGYMARRTANDCVALRRDGARVPIALTVSTVEMRGEQVHVGLVRDISQDVIRSQVEDFIHGLDSKILSDPSPRELSQEICTDLSIFFEAPVVFMAGQRRGGEGLDVLAHAGPEATEEHLRLLESCLLDVGCAKASPLFHICEQGRLRVLSWQEDAAAEARAGLCAPLEGFDWLVCIPLRAGGEQEVKQMVVFCGRDQVPDEVTQQRMEAMAVRVGAALQTLSDQKQLRLQGTAMAAAANAIFITDVNGQIEWVNEAFTRLSGFEAEEAIGQRPSLLKSGIHGEEFYENLWNTILQGKVWRGEVVERRKDGTLFTVEQTVAPILDERGKIAHFVAVHEDVTERKKAEERILYLSNYDTLTRLPNRVLFRDYLYQAVTRARGDRNGLAVLFVDLDHFSRVNDTLGHKIGDQFLMTVASRINAVATTYADTVARIGGDEFAIIQSRLPNADSAALLAQKVIDAVKTPVDIDGLEVRVGANVGIAIYPQDGDDPDHLIKNADMAMYRAIRSETEEYFFFSNEMNDEARVRLGMEGDLRRALDNGDLSLHYQPQIDAKSRRVVGLEALLRWHHPTQGTVSPARFIPVAEDSGLILPMGDWVLNEALRQARAWRDAGLPVVTMAVNISAVQFRQRNMVKTVQSALSNHGIDPSRVELELTESMLMQDAREAVATLNHLSDLGALLAIDDFGTGYSSLSYLKQFPVDKLKLDQSFVRHMTSDYNDAVIARATINLGHSLGLEVIAEGVETPEQYTYLRDEGCDVIQGYLFGRPMPPAEVAEVLAAQAKGAVLGPESLDTL